MSNEKTLNFPEPEAEKNVGIVIDDGTEEVPITNLRGQRGDGSLGVFHVEAVELKDRVDLVLIQSKVFQFTGFHGIPPVQQLSVLSRRCDLLPLPC